MDLTNHSTLTMTMYYFFVVLISLNVFLFLDSIESIESKLCGASNCTEKCCLGSNFYPLCRTSCEGLICMYNENCDGGFCCVRQCVKNSLACQDILPTQSRRSGDDDKSGDFATWEFALIVLASVIAGILLCILVIWGCRAFISRI